MEKPRFSTVGNRRFLQRQTFWIQFGIEDLNHDS